MSPYNAYIRQGMYIQEQHIHSCALWSSTNLIPCFAWINFNLNKISLRNQRGKVNSHNFCLPNIAVLLGWKKETTPMLPLQQIMMLLHLGFDALQVVCISRCSILNLNISSCMNALKHDGKLRWAYGYELTCPSHGYSMVHLTHENSVSESLYSLIWDFFGILRQLQI